MGAVTTEPGIQWMAQPELSLGEPLMESEDPPSHSFSQCVERVGSGVCIVGGSGLRAWTLCLKAVLKSAGSPDLVPLVCLDSGTTPGHLLRDGAFHVTLKHPQP